MSDSKHGRVFQVRELEGTSRYGALPLLLLISACSTVNMPQGNTFPLSREAANSVSVFADANGTLYPTGWQQRIRPNEVARAKSLFNGAAPDERGWLRKQHDVQVAQLGERIRSSRRVYIFVHGYNINESDAENAFNILENAVQPAHDDFVIRLHWDGMTGRGVGNGTIWFAAAGYSQVVGLQALRPILGQAVGKDVFLVSHSRGASVMLSALATEDIPFGPDFRRKTEALSRRFGTELLRAPPLQNNGNRVRVVLLGPAVGLPDFWSRDCELGGAGDCSIPTNCANYRTLTPQLKSITYTLNDGDRTLRKYISNLSPYFNATNLGWDASVGGNLARCYSNISMNAVKVRPHSHAFRLYAGNPDVKTLIASIQ